MLPKANFGVQNLFAKAGNTELCVQVWNPQFEREKDWRKNISSLFDKLVLNWGKRLFLGQFYKNDLSWVLVAFF